jgi:hypothetical protein
MRMKTSFIKATGQSKNAQTKESSTKDVTAGDSRSGGGSSKFIKAPGMSKSPMMEGSIKDVTGGVSEKSCDSKPSMKTTVKFIK